MDKQLLEKLIELLKIDTFAQKRNNLLGAQNFVKEYLSSIPITWEILDSINPELAPILLGKSKLWNSNKPTITLSCHLDIVFPNIDDFDIRVEREKLYGPGAVDMKAGVLVILEVVKELQNLGNLSNLQILLTSDEEQYQTRYYPQLKNIALSTDYLLVYEGAGSLTQEPNFQIKNLVIKRKGILGYKLSAKASGGHSGGLAKEEERHSAIHELIKQSEKILSLADFSKGTTINIGKFNGGRALNILAEEAEIQFDARIVSADEFRRIKYALSRLTPIDPKVEIHLEQLLEGSPVEATQANINLLELGKAAGDKVGIQIGIEDKSGASDMNRLVGFNPKMASIDYLGPSGGGEHSSGEFLYIKSFDPCVTLSVELISSILRTIDNKS